MSAGRSLLCQRHRDCRPWFGYKSIEIDWRCCCWQFRSKMLPVVLEHHAVTAKQIVHNTLSKKKNHPTSAQKVLRCFNEGIILRCAVFFILGSSFVCWKQIFRFEPWIQGVVTEARRQDPTMYATKRFVFGHVWFELAWFIWRKLQHLPVRTQLYQLRVYLLQNIPFMLVNIQFNVFSTSLFSQC